MHRLTNLTSTAGSFASEYYSGASTLLRKLTQPSGAFITNTYDSVARLLSTTLKNSGRATLNAHAYTVNAAGQLKTASGKESGGSTNRWQEQFGYAYDAAGNLNQRTNHSLLQTFTAGEFHSHIRSGASLPPPDPAYNRRNRQV